ncbi:SgcJ/EcaC family oxidoreductase [Phenylobacterium sp.]|uniref:YybH family protein n=1 Tax=Phenylobacterium sp. TaxID=1871053 RepID=UPI002C0414F5|nr:SgcJ/EcaC family oxidoreductase [Phenylobacterium sp.]HVI32425.1 SgcJ/EcaC family oxidoreductase [Phenylobacterium sp.]
MMKTLLAAGLACAVTTAAQAAPPSAADEAALRALGAAADAAWNARDPAAMAGHYARDADMLVGASDGQVQRGRAAVEAYYARSFGARQGVMRHVSEIRNLDMLGPDLALSDVAVRVEARQPDGTWKLMRRFNNVSISVREDGAWKLKAVRAYPIG